MSSELVARLAMADSQPRRVMYYLLLYEVVDQFTERRIPFRDSHLQLAGEAHERGELLLAGAFAEPADGAALVFTTDALAVVEHFVEADPYVREGLVTAWKVRKWSLVVGAD
jgi:uncharacterized protein